MNKIKGVLKQAGRSSWGSPAGVVGLLIIVFILTAFQTTGGNPVSPEQWGDYGIATALAGWSIYSSRQIKERADEKEAASRERIYKLELDHAQYKRDVEAKVSAELRAVLQSNLTGREAWMETMMEFKVAINGVQKGIASLQLDQAGDLARKIEQMEKLVAKRLDEEAT